MNAATGRGAPRLSIEARRMLPVCIGLSLALHLLALVIGSIRLAPSGGAAQAAGAAPGRISVRLVQAPRLTDPVAPPVAEAAPLAAADPTQTARAERPPAASAPLPMQAAASAASAAQGPALPPATDAFGAPLPTLPIRERFDYVPRPLLTVPPVAQAPILIVAPSDAGDVARHVGVLALFLNEQGQVDRIVAEQPPLPPAMERAAYDAFMAARFAPGQVDGQIVKSRVRVEVVFDNTPLPASGVSGPTSRILDSR